MLMGVASRIDTGPHNQSRADVKSRKVKYVTSDGVLSLVRFPNL